MARLPRMPERVATLRPVLAAPKDQAGRTRHRLGLSPWRAWYSTARWKRLRWSTLLRDMFTCQRCGRVEADTSLLVADHKTPHRGDPVLFWDAENLQCLCRSCHDGAKQREERRAF